MFWIRFPYNVPAGTFYRLINAAHIVSVEPVTTKVSVIPVCWVQLSIGPGFSSSMTFAEFEKIVGAISSRPIEG